MSSRLTRVRLAFLAVGVGITTAGIATVTLQAVDSQVSNTGEPNGYRGLVTANFDPADTHEEIAGDFGSLGVWVFDEGTWSRITAENPDWIITIKWGNPLRSDLIASFPDKGIWRWTFDGPPGTWEQLTAVDVKASAIALDDDGDGREELEVAFRWVGGLWRYDFDTHAWMRLSTATPWRGLRSDVGEVGPQEGLWQFPEGLWLVSMVGGTPHWTQLTSSWAYSGMAAGNFVDDGTDPDDELIVDFGRLTAGGMGNWESGIWQWDDGTWTLLTPERGVAMLPVRFGADAKTELLVLPVSLTPWRYSPWRQLSAQQVFWEFAVAYDGDRGTAGEPAVEQELAVAFQALGLWQYDSTTETWRQLTTAAASFMVPGDCYGDGTQTTLVADFGTALGVWLYDSGGSVRPAAWHQIATATPDDSIFFTWPPEP